MLASPRRETACLPPSNDQIGHPQSHDVDIILDDPQLLGFIDPSRSSLRHDVARSDYQGDELRFQKFAFDGAGETDFIVAGALPEKPLEAREAEVSALPLETIPEIISKKVYHRGSEATPRDIFDIAGAARLALAPVVNALCSSPEQVSKPRSG